MHIAALMFLMCAIPLYLLGPEVEAAPPIMQFNCVVKFKVDG